MNESLTNRQIAFYIFGIVVGYGFISLPKDIAENAGTGGWISMLISTFVVVISTYIITYLGYIFKGKTIYEYSNLLIGKFFTTIFMAIYILYYFSFFTMAARISSETIKLTILSKTPIWALNLLILLVVYYTLTKRLRSIGRICEYFGVVIILSTLFMHFNMLTEGKMINLRPFLGSESAVTYLKAMTVTLVPFLGFEALTVVALDDKNSKNVFLYSTLMIVFIGLFYILIVESCISLIVVDDIVYYNDAVLAAIRRLQLPYLEFLRRLDGLFIITWTMAVYCTVTIFAYSCILLISKWFSKINFNLIALVVTILSFIAAIIIGNFELARNILTYVGYVGILPAFIIPLILLIIVKVKKYDKKKA